MKQKKKKETQHLNFHTHINDLDSIHLQRPTNFSFEFLLRGKFSFELVQNLKQKKKKKKVKNTIFRHETEVVSFA